MGFLYTNGDSWSAGEEVENDPICKHEVTSTNLTEIRNKYSFGGIIARELGYTHINGAINGGSNYRTVRTTCDFIQSFPKEDYDKLIVVIGWTSAERHELFLRLNGEPFWGRVFLDQILREDRILSEDQTKLGKTPALKEYLKIYLRTIYSRQAVVDSYINHILLLSSLLQNLGIKHYFFDALSGLWDYDNNCLPEDIASRRAKIKTKNMNHDISMAGFCQSAGVPFGAGHHCLAEGHKIWGNDILSKLTTLYPELKK